MMKCSQQALHICATAGYQLKGQTLDLCKSARLIEANHAQMRIVNRKAKGIKYMTSVSSTRAIVPLEFPVSDYGILFEIRRDQNTA